MPIELSADMPPPLVPLSWLVGVWVGAGVVGYPTMETDLRFGQEVEFSHDGKKVKFTSSLGEREKIAEGTTVPVRYLPADPEGSAEIATPKRMWGFPIAALGVGALFVVLGVAMGK